MSAERGHADGIEYDFTHKHEVADCSFFQPKGTVHRDAEPFWREIDAHRTRSPDAVVSTIGDAALPRDLSVDAQRRIYNRYGQWLADRWGGGVEVSFHNKPDNPHIHWQQSHRRILQDGSLGTLNRELNAIAAQREDKRDDYDWDRRPVAAIEMRRKWADLCNRELEKEGFAIRYDPTSYQTRGIDKEPGRHVGRGGEASDQRRDPIDRQETIKVSELRAHLALQRAEQQNMVETSRARIREIQDARKTPAATPSIAARIGDAKAWQDDTLNTFMRAWKAGDRATELRRRVREVRERHAPLRDPTEAEAKELRRCGRAAARAEKIVRGIDGAEDRLAKLDRTATLKISLAGKIKQDRLKEIDQAIDHAKAMRPRMKMRMSR